MYNRVAIIGAGPAGCALACLLRLRGVECLVFDDNKKPSLVVGESLIPAAITILRQLGIEKAVSKVSLLKKGAALRHNSGTPRVDFEFQNLGKDTPEYAYNIPRPQFDNILRERAIELGAQFIHHKASVIKADSHSRKELELSADSLASAGLDSTNQPDLLVDATGRRRLFSRILKLEATHGLRNDIAHFAHFENYSSDSKIPGQIVITILEHGWSWQIPLKNCTSFGAVLNTDAAKYYGATASERLENIMRDNPALDKAEPRRISEAMTYSNYQLIAKRGFGRGWVLLGDAFGFVDPMLSPGVFMSLESARLLDERLFKSPEQSDIKNSQNLDLYANEIKQWHKAWSTLIEYFYSGKVLALGEMRPDVDTNTKRFSIGRLIDRMISKMLSRLVSGVSTRSTFSQKALAVLCHLLLRDQDKLERYSVKNKTSSIEP